MSHACSHEGEVTADELGTQFGDLDLDSTGGFPNLGAAMPQLEGDKTLSVSGLHACAWGGACILTCVHIALTPPIPRSAIAYQVQARLTSYLKNTLKSKNSICALLDKIRPLSDDPACKQRLGKPVLADADRSHELQGVIEIASDERFAGRSPSLTSMPQTLRPRMTHWLNCRRKGKPLVSVKRALPALHNPTHPSFQAVLFVLIISCFHAMQLVA